MPKKSSSPDRAERPYAYRAKFRRLAGPGPYECSACGDPVAFDDAHIHHWDGNRENNDIENLAPLHRGCHHAMHERREPLLPKGESLTMTLPEAAKLLHVSRQHAYALVKRGEFPVPVVRVGHLFRVPVAPLKRLLGLEEGVA